MGYFHYTVLHIVLVTSLLAFVTSKDGAVCTPSSRVHSQGICGKEINEVLKFLCGEEGYYSEHTKRSSDLSVLPADIGDMSASAFLKLTDGSAQAGSRGLMDVLYDKDEAFRILQKRRNYYQRGVACECCYHRCTLRDMTNYCKAPKAALRRLGSINF